MKFTDFWINVFAGLFFLYVLLHPIQIIAFLDRFFAPLYPC